MDWFIFRPLLFAAVEYTVALYIFRKNVYLAKTISVFLFFLASYQMGEYLYFISGKPFALQVAYFSTTMLPPIGIHLLEKITGKKFGAWILTLIFIGLGIVFLISPGLVYESDRAYCFMKVLSQEGNSDSFVIIWLIFYLLTLLYAILGATIIHVHNKDGIMRYRLRLLILTYLLFYPSSILLATLLNFDANFIPSVMCALALLTIFPMLQLQKQKVLR